MGMQTLDLLKSRARGRRLGQAALVLHEFALLHVGELMSARASIETVSPFRHMVTLLVDSSARTQQRKCRCTMGVRGLGRRRSTALPRSNAAQGRATSASGKKAHQSHFS